MLERRHKVFHYFKVLKKVIEIDSTFDLNKIQESETDQHALCKAKTMVVYNVTRAVLLLVFTNVV